MRPIRAIGLLGILTLLPEVWSAHPNFEQDARVSNLLTASGSDIYADYNNSQRDVLQQKQSMQNWPKITNAFNQDRVPLIR